MDNYNIMFDKWRRKILRVCWLIVSIVLFIEILFYFVYYLPDPSRTPGYDKIKYITFFLIIPTVVNFSAVAICGSIINSRDYSNTVRKYATITMVTILCAVTMLVHYVFPPLICIFFVPIFLTTMFANRKMITFFYLISYVFIAISYVEAKNGFFPDDPNLFYNYIVAIIVINCAYFISLVITNFQKGRTEEIIKAYEKQIELNELLKLDQLTSLYNHTTIHQTINELVDINYKTKQKLILAIIDIDDFKHVNDAYGHSKGDQVIMVLARIIKEYANRDAFCARYGGEEFAILFTDINLEKAVEIVDRIEKEFAVYDFGFSFGERVTFSCGIAEFVDNSWTAIDFFDVADGAMYEAKASGKNKTVVANGKISR